MWKTVVVTLSLMGMLSTGESAGMNRDAEVKDWENKAVTGADATTPVRVEETENGLTVSNRFVVLRFDWANYSYSLADAASGETVLANASMAADGWGPKNLKGTDRRWAACKISHTVEAALDPWSGQGRRVVVALENPRRPAVPVYLFSFSVYDGDSAVRMGFGMRNSREFGIRLLKAEPMVGAEFLPGRPIENALTLNGAAGARKTAVLKGLSRESENSLMLTGLVGGKRRTVVWGGLANKEFGKWASLGETGMGFRAEDPVGRLVDPGQTYWSDDTFYLDVWTADPFAALERYGRAMRVANNAKPNVYDFPVLCGWSVGAMSRLPNINNSKLLVGEWEAANKCGFTRYTKVAIRLEPDFYCYANGNTEQGWWDDEHWARFGHLVPPYETMAKWCAALQEKGGIPYLYFQVGLPSDDYARAFPGHMLFNDIGRLAVSHRHHEPLVGFDYTDPEFQQRTLAMWKRLRSEGVRGIKFDYPETGWRPEGGFENRYATAAFAYRETYRLCREGLGADAFLDERNLGESDRPCLDLTAGLVDTQRNWRDSNRFAPAMVTISGLRWYKNRTVFNYFPDTKTVHDCTSELRQSMLTMIFLTSGRIDLATSFSRFTPEIVQDFSRIYPVYREPFTARPLDAFAGVTDPQVYDLELTPDWHQVALFNTGNESGTVSAPLSGDRAGAGAIGLDPTASYYVYDFWGDTFVGRLSGSATVEQKLQPLCCAMLSVRKVQSNPQVLSTNRHVLQGWVELADVKWDASKQLTGKADLIGGEPMRIVLAGNGLKPVKATAEGADATIETHAAAADLAILTLRRPDNGRVSWRVEYQ